jgi:hypothetical protein
MTDTLNYLKKTKELIASEVNWTKQVEARDERGRQVLATSPDAVCFCLMGALRRISYKDCGVIPRPPYPSFVAYYDTIAALNKCLPSDPKRPNETIVSFNDSHTHADVISLLDSTIAGLENDQVA